MRNIALAFIMALSMGCSTLEDKVKECALEFVPYDKTSEAVAGCMDIYKPGVRQPRRERAPVDPIAPSA